MNRLNLNKRVLIVIVSYYPNKSFFDHNLKLEKFNYLIVDNTPNLNSSFVERISQYENVDLSLNGNNLGIAKGFNVGCDFARKNGYQFVVTMDQDSFLNEDIINDLVDFYDHNEDKKSLAVISPRHISNTNRALNNVVYDADGVYEGIATMSSGNLLPLNIWNEIGGFDEKLFIDMVDTDYYIRAIMCGFKVITLRDVEMEHVLGELEERHILGRAVAVLGHNHIRKYYQIRNACYIMAQYGKYNYVAMVFDKFMIKTLLKVILFEKNKLKKMKYMLKGYIDFKRKRYGSI
ncbi:glycosyltransferase [Cysteiniphilum litorale]|uniref:glycosyltransferase n=1 Tax=Cysteiniphilum litorale TaxID=2056700 RepID=UPI003F884FC8